MTALTRLWRAAGGQGQVDEPLLLEWFTLGGLLVFATWLLGVRGVWHLLLTSDPTGLTLVIIVVFVVSTLWWRQPRRGSCSANGG